METNKRTAYVSVETEADKTKRKNLHLASAFVAFVWMLFHFTVVYFFTLQLGSPMLVGIFLGIGNLVSLVLDVPVGILIRYFSPKKLYFFAVLSQLFAGLVFLKFIYAAAVFGGGGNAGITALLENFLDSVSNLFLLFVAACMYGFTKEVNDITTLSYILNNSDPSEYSSIISKNNIYSGVGSLLGLLASGTVLAFDPTVAVFVLNAFILLLAAFIASFFDNETRTITLSDVTKLKVIAKRPNIERLKEYAIGYVAKADFSKLAQDAKLVFLKPIALKTDFDPAIIVPETKKEIASIRKVLFSVPYHYGLLWLMSMILTFGFWDTFAASFLVDFLGRLSTGPSFAYVMLGIIAIPAFVTQDAFIGLARRIGTYPVVLFGLFLSGLSILLLAFFSENTLAVILCGIGNSLGYAAGMGVAQGEFLDRYNSEFAQKESLAEIDCNASASPMKIVQNFANVLGLTFGGTLLAIFGYVGFFIVFGLLLVGMAVATIVKKPVIDPVETAEVPGAVA